MAFDANATVSAELTVNNTLDFLLDSAGNVMVATLTPREILNVIFQVTVWAGIPTDNVICEVLTGMKMNSGTTQAGGSTTTAKLAAGAGGANDVFNGDFIVFTSGSQKGKAGIITDFVYSTLIATFTPAMGAAPDAMTYDIYKLSSRQFTIPAAARGLEDIGQSGIQILGPQYALFRASASAATDAHKVRVAYQGDGVSA